MGRDDGKLTAAKRSYRNAKEEGNRKEEARWANVIGHIFKNRGEYVEALKWLRLDYEVSNKYLPEKQLLPTCQSLGEVHLRLEHFEDALRYQKQHLELARDSDDLVEQQRASTQLGRTYYEIFLRSQDDHNSKRNAKKYFKLSLSLAQTLKEKPPSNSSSFLKEYIDAHNNIGMLEMELDNLEEAEKWLTKGLAICDEEEVIEDDDGRTRLHHNLGCVYTELRKWDEARVHIEKDIIICKRIGHCQGEAKGYINLGELHYRVQKYEDAIRCYQKALNLAKSMEDEDALVEQIYQNIETVKEAMKVMDDLKKEEQALKKLTRNTAAARGTPGERKCLLLLNASLDRLIEKSSTTFAWLKHREFAKRKKRVASELCDKEKLGDAYLVIGESYQKLRNFSKAHKWYKKSWEIYKSIGNLEGEALAKINIGDVLDGDGNWRGALDAFEEGYWIAVKANLPSVQLSALENMHYSNMIRFDNAEEARRLQLLIDKLKQSKGLDNETHKMTGDACSETDTEGEDMPNSRYSIYSPKISKSSSGRFQQSNSMEELKDDAPLISFLRTSKSSPKLKSVCSEKLETCNHLSEASRESMSKSTSCQKKSFSRKRVRIVLSDDEDEMDDGTATSYEFKNRNGPSTPICNHQGASVVNSERGISICNPANLEESSCSYKSKSPKVATPSRKFYKSSSMDEVAFASDCVASGSKCDSGASESQLFKYDAASPKLHTSDQNNRCMTFKVENDLIQVEASSFVADGKLNIESMKVEAACLYYLQLPTEKRLKGLLPIIQHVKCGGRTLESSQTLKDDLQNMVVEVDISGWVQKRLMKMYIDCCKELCEAPNVKLLKKLYNLEVSDDEIVVSDCELQDISIAPLLSALHTHKTIATLNFSHNLLGNGTMEKIQQIFSSSSQKCGSLTLDLHCNRFGPTALFQICECPVLLARLEVLNISGNRLTDASGSYLSTILENCKGLYNLNIERCSLTSRTIQKVADALHAGSVLSQLSIGYNNLVSGNAITNLLAKLTTLERFTELNLNGLKLSKPVVASLCQFAKTSCLSGLMLGGTGIGTDGALQLTESLFSETHELVKLDLSRCGLTSEFIFKLNTDIAPVCAIIELNLGGNPILHEASNVLVSLLTNPQCCLKILVLDNCQLGLAGVLHIIQALSENDSLEELNLANNADPGRSYTLQYGSTTNSSLELPQPDLNTSKSSPKVCDPQEDENAEHDICAMNSSCNQLEVADSEDEMGNGEDAAPGLEDSSASTWQRNSSSLECQFIEDLSAAVAMAKHLQLLDISNNGVSAQAAEKLFNTWSLSGARAGSAVKHIEDQTIHFSVEGNKCCGLKPCCRRD